MKLHMQSVRFDADVKLLEFIQRKMDKLETFYDRIVDGEVILRVENDEAKENKIVEVKMNIPGDQLFAKTKAKSFEAAADEAAEALRRQLKKFKEKQLTK
ncbi:MAG: ribosome-associated translation inhibitor RaiA [Cyclobacteriaceae bacterium]